MSDDLRAKLDSIQLTGRERLAGAASAADVDAPRHELLWGPGRPPPARRPRRRGEGGAWKPAADGTILRTHPSPTQIRAMRALKAPIRVLTPGRCFRYKAVATRPASPTVPLSGR